MKHIKIKSLFLLSLLALTGCNNTQNPSSASSFNYEEPSSLGAEGYIFNMDGKYALNPVVKETIATFGDILDQHEIPTLLEVISTNDFYATSLTYEYKDVDNHDYGENGLTIDEGNFNIVKTGTITRNNTTHTISGELNYKAKDYENDFDIDGTYEISYDDGLFAAYEKLDYEGEEYDFENATLLNDQFVETYLALINAEAFLNEMIEASEDDDSIFSPTEFSTHIGQNETSISLHRSTLLTNIRHDQDYNLVIDKEGFVKQISYKLISYYGSTVAAPVLREHSYKATYSA